MSDELNAQLQMPVQEKLQENRNMILQILGHCADLVERPFIWHDPVEVHGILFYIDGLSNTQQLDFGVLRPLVIDSLQITLQYNGSFDAVLHTDSIVGRQVDRQVDRMTNEVLLSPELKVVTQMDAAIAGILAGESLILLEGSSRAVLAGTKGWDARSPAETQTEIVLRGPRDGFIENLRTNTSLVRRRVRDPMLRLEGFQIGERTKTDVNIAYIAGIAKPDLIDEVRKRLQSITIDAVLESGYIEEFIEDAPFSPFRTLTTTERPDRVAAVLLEGRIAIFVDNTPFVLIAPTSLWEALIASDDYYSHFYLGSFSRIIRYFAFFCSLILPSLYVMLVSFHQEMIPTKLAISIAAGRESVPFPALFEVFMMELSFEMMREAGLRMPRPIGQTVSIVGSLIIGQAAVQAGLVSPLIVIIVALTGIASFAIPGYSTSFAIRLLRFPLLIASGTLGLLGFAAVIFIVVVHLLSLRSFGEPFLAPVIPFRDSDQKDSMIRFPWWAMKKRPWLAKNDVRLGNHQKPAPHKLETTLSAPVTDSSTSQGIASVKRGGSPDKRSKRQRKVFKMRPK